jgi:pullulanase
MNDLFMKKTIMFLGFLLQFFSGKAQKNEFSSYPVYTGNDLGLIYSPLQSAFRIWAPTAEEAQLFIYDDGTSEAASQTIVMKKDAHGVWKALLDGDHKGKYYAFRVKIKGAWMNEVPDPYAKAVGLNGKRALIIDLQETNPVSWSNDKSPVFKNKTDAIIYELHVRDAGIAENSGIKNKGKFLGLTEKSTKNSEGLSTGLDHLKELGVTHIHLLPSFDFNSIDESKPENPQYNWGYDPLNYNVPEGSYSTNASDGSTRIREFKQLVKTFHENGLRVIMDVAYNHTALTEASNFNQLVPGYYYRHTADGKFSNATACGNETASERPMMRKFILESMKYWVQEYHIDGFRIDLMGVHDIVTMNLVSKELHQIKPDILLYGEGWTAGSSPLADSQRALKKNGHKLDRIAVFSDDIRDGIKGQVFTPADKGFASGKPGLEESIKFGVTAACKHPQVNYKKVNYSFSPYAAQPYQTITYCECHDNHALWDKLAISAKNATEADRKEMHKLSLSIVLTSQGIAFLHAGTEFLRSKKGVENSFESPDSINAIDWNLKSKNKHVFDYVKALITMRKEHPAFRMTDAKQIAQNIRFSKDLPGNIVAYTINGSSVNDRWKKIYVAYNGNGSVKKVPLPTGTWKVFIKSNALPGRIENIQNSISPAPYSCTILYQ